MNIVCTDCGTEYPADTHEWICIRCGGLFELESAPRLDPARIDPQTSGLWRYRDLLPLPANARPVTMGEGWTPLIPSKLDGVEFLAKCDYLNPSGSFKDRGTTVIVSALKAFGVSRCLEDSSGNAAASLAAYCAYAGIQAEIFAPAYASPAKLAQIEIYGARLRRIEGPRENSARAVQDEAGKGEAYYASHYYNPYALAGMQTTAWEIWEQLGRRAPAGVIAPVGHGTNFIGLARGFRALLQAGFIEHMPRLYAAQAANVAPLALAFARGDKEVPTVESKRTIAEGISIVHPVRGKEILREIRETNGKALAVGEDEIIQARVNLARGGLFVEPTSATAVAALKLVRESLDGPIVVTLTGSGLKSPL